MNALPYVSDFKFEDVISVVRGLNVDNAAVTAEVLSRPRVNGSDHPVTTVSLKDSENPVILDMHQQVSAQVLAFCQRNNTGHTSVEIAECWGHATEKGDAVPTHVHPTSFISAVYYPAVADKSCKLRFDRPNWAAMAFQIMRFRPDSTPMTRQFIDIQPDSGVLVISPSWLPRGVTPTAANGTRVSVVYKFMASGDSDNKPWGKMLLGETI